jgi:crotonobetainyl-CoA:carnitine CoA-transferase CaiB-like acyl-CoA transferase
MSQARDSDRPGPLNGVTVLEFGSIVFAPLTGQHLGDMDANVIKVEAPRGDLTRYIGPHRSDGMSALFLSCNRNKRSLVLDLKRPEARALLPRLVVRADVVINTIRTDQAERLGLSYSELAKHNPQVIFCHAKGFSDIGTYGGKPAYDDVIQALSGLAALQSVVAGEPRYVPSIIADKVAALQAAYAIALALYHRTRTGRGQAIDIPMLETMVAFNTAEHLWGHVFEPPLADMGYVPVRYAMRRPFPTEDGHLAVLPYSDAQWRRFFELIDRSSVMEDPRFETFAARQQNHEVVWGEVADRLLERTTEEWVQLLENEDIPFARVNALEDLPDDPHLRSVDFWQLIEHPTEGLMRTTRNPVSMSDSPPRIRRLAPRLGEHTEEVLRELGIDDATVDTILELKTA